VQQNFPVKTGETAFLFLQHFVKSLKAGGRAAIVIKNTFLSNTDNASVSLRKLFEIGGRDSENRPGLCSMPRQNRVNCGWWLESLECRYFNVYQ